MRKTSGGGIATPRDFERRRSTHALVAIKEAAIRKQAASQLDQF
jgi:hypothetical protein